MDTPDKPSFLDEYNLNFENNNYLLKLGKISNKIEQLLLFVNEENKFNSCCYQESFSLEKLQKINKCFKQFDSIDEIIIVLKEIISDKKVSIKKINNDLIIIIKVNKLGKGEEVINFILSKKRLSNEMIIQNLINHINNMEVEINKLKKEKINTNVKKFIPKFENGWKNYGAEYEKLTIFKNPLNEIKFQGLICGDFSKKIFTLDKELRPHERLIFTICVNDKFNRLDICTNGDVFLSNGGSSGIGGEGWLSLNGISYYI